MKILIPSVALILLIYQASCLSINMKIITDLVLGSWRLLTALVDDVLTPTSPMHLDSYKDDAEAFQSMGYRFEIHKIKTEDEYILTAWRIPGKISESMKEISKKPPVILQHGLLDNSVTWSINYFNNTLPYLLLEEGYDVWLTNNRGNFNSYEHTNPFNYSVFDMKSKYWNFSFDQMAKYDLPANIDYILDYTSKEKIIYIGHSQGSVQFFAANCLQNVAKKVEAFVALGPVIYANHMESPMVSLLLTFNIERVLKFFEFNNIMLWPKIVNVSLKDIVVRFKKTIWRLIQLICGVSEEINIDLERLPVIGRREPGGTSLNNILHFKQIMDSGKFEMIDFGSENINIYGQSTPPEYNTTKMEQNMKDLDILFIRGSNDPLSNEADFKQLLNHFQDKVGTSLEVKTVHGYGHLDYIWAKDSMSTVNRPIIDFLNKRRTKH